MFKIDEIREIIRLIDQSSINEFSYENNGAKIKVKKENKLVVPQVNHEQQVVVNDAAVEEQQMNTTQEKVIVKETPKQEPQTEEANGNDENIVEITSPMVGTFYRKPSPDSDAYVQIGDKIEESSIVCIVEAMKLFNEIEAEVAGEIVEILVEDGELVEYGQPLFKVKTK